MSNLRHLGIRAIGSTLASVGMIFALAFFTAQTGWSQHTAGAIHGQVVDPTGASIPEATITVTNKDTGQERTATTTSNGTYNVPSLPIGVYTVSATAPGFRRSVSDNVEVPVNVRVMVDLGMELGAVSETVEVTAAAPLLQTSDSTVGEVVDHEKVVRLPLNGRQFTQLILLMPGASYRQSGQQDAFTVSLGAGSINPAVNGQNSHYNNFTLDGLENNQRFNNRSAINPPPDAIEEFKVQSHISDARFGLGAGANVNVATKSGTGDFHGNVWEFIRNDKLDAATFFDNVAADTNEANGVSRKPPYRQNQFGFTVGGPVVLPGYDGRKANTYFFAYYEGFRSRKGFTAFANVPTAAELTGDFSALLGGPLVDDSGSPKLDARGRQLNVGEILNPFTTTAVGGKFVRDPFPGNMIDPSLIDANTLRYAQLMYVAPNTSFGGNNLVFNPNEAIDGDSFGIRLDHHFRNNDVLFGRFSLMQNDREAPGVLPSTPTLQQNTGRSVMISYTHLISPTFIFDFKGGYMRSILPISPRPAGLDFVNSVGFSDTVRLTLDWPAKGTAVGPNTAISPRTSPIQQWGWGLGNPDYQYQYNFDLTKVKGNHTIFGGLELMHWRHITGNQPFFSQNFDTLATRDPNSGEGGDGLASFLLGLPSVGSAVAFNPTNIWGNIFILYLQDDWKVTPKLTLNLGLQWDGTQRARFKDDAVSMPDPTDGIIKWGGVNPITGEPANMRRTMYEPDWNNFAPRVGFAYRVMPRTVIRGGFNVFYDHGNSLIQDTRATTSQWPYGPIFNQTSAALNNTVFTGRTFADPLVFKDVSEPIAGNWAVNRHNRDMYSMQWNLGIQRALSSSVVFDIAYVGAGGRKIWITPTANVAPLPGPDTEAQLNFDTRPFPQFQTINFITGVGKANYHALQTKLTKRFSRGLSLLASYTYGRSFDTGAQRGSRGQDIFNLQSGYGPSDWDSPQIFTFSYVYELPFGSSRQFGGAWGGAKNAVLGGWMMTGIIRASDGHPFSLGAGGNIANTGSGGQLASLASGEALLPSGFNQTREQWFNTDAVTTFPFTYGNLSRNIMRGPGIHNWDMGFSKFFNFTENSNLEFRAEIFNIWNQTNFGQPGTAAGSTTLGVINGLKLPSREIQFGLKFRW